MIRHIHRPATEKNPSSCPGGSVLRHRVKQSARGADGPPRASHDVTADLLVGKLDVLRIECSMRRRQAQGFRCEGTIGTGLFTTKGSGPDRHSPVPVGAVFWRLAWAHDEGALGALATDVL